MKQILRKFDKMNGLPLIFIKYPLYLANTQAAIGKKPQEKDICKLLEWPCSTMDSIRVSEAPDPGSIPGKAT
jgi:hypothetical protein